MIEIKGGGTKNKGAHLMLLAIMEQFQKEQNTYQFCCDHGYGMSYPIARRHGLFLKIDFKKKKKILNKFFALFPEKTLENLGLVFNSKVNVVLDTSGFSYGDYWGSEKINRRLSNVLKNKTAQPTKLILLPQALGPFEDKKVKMTFEKVVDKADLIFARDEVSYNYLTQAFGERPTFFQAPDFTNLLDAGEEKNYKEGNVCIIPNARMIKNPENEKAYYDFLKQAIQCVKKHRECVPYFLIHEGKADAKIAEEVNHDLDEKLPVACPRDPLVIKNRIKSARLIIVSRFHGLVSALSQGTPAISTAWSHKYKEVMSDYDQEDKLIDINNYEQVKLESMIAQLITVPKENFREQQRPFIMQEKKRTKAMWDKVFNALNA